MKSISALKNK